MATESMVTGRRRNAGFPGNEAERVFTVARKEFTDRSRAGGSQ